MDVGRTERQRVPALPRVTELPELAVARSGLRYQVLQLKVDRALAAGPYRGSPAASAVRLTKTAGSIPEVTEQQGKLRERSQA